MPTAPPESSCCCAGGAAPQAQCSAGPATPASRGWSVGVRGAGRRAGGQQLVQKCHCPVPAHLPAGCTICRCLQLQAGVRVVCSAAWALEQRRDALGHDSGAMSESSAAAARSSSWVCVPWLAGGGGGGGSSPLAVEALCCLLQRGIVARTCPFDFHRLQRRGHECRCSRRQLCACVAPPAEAVDSDRSLGLDGKAVGVPGFGYLSTALPPGGPARSATGCTNFD